MFRWKVLVASCVFALLISCTAAIASDIKCFVLQPPDQTLPGVQKLAILDFNGMAGRAISDYLISSLLVKGHGIGTIKGGLFSKDKEGVTYLSGARTDIFTIVERSRLDQVLKEQALGAAGVVDEKQAAALGKVLGVDAIVMGTIIPSSNDATDRRQQTVYSGGKKSNILVDCTTRKVGVTVRMRVVNATTGEILGTKEAHSEIQDDKCGDERAQLATVESLVDQCVRFLADGDLANYLAPHFVQSKFELKDIKVKEYEKLGDQAGDAAENGQLDKSFTLYSAILKDDPYNDAAYYNIGVLHEVVGNYAEADTAYQKASSIRQDDDYTKAIDHCRRLRSFGEILASMGISIQKHSFAVSQTQMASATAEKIRLKGDSGDRISIRSTPEHAGSVVAKVPGGIELELVEKSGEWIKVKTFDGKVGFVNKEDVR
jgi:hypothetical protein